MDRFVGKVGKISTVVAVLFAIFILAFAQNNNINNPRSCLKGTMNITTKKACCANLNKARQQNYTLCCNYPKFVIWTWQWNICKAQCKYTFFDDIKAALGIYSTAYKCQIPCCYRWLKMLDDKPEVNGILIEGIKFAFMLSVRNDTRWAQIINDAVQDSNYWYRQDIPPKNTSDPVAMKNYDNFWFIYEQVPRYCQIILDSAYYQHYLRCPTFNSTIDRCDLARQYVQDCLVDANE